MDVTEMFDLDAWVTAHEIMLRDQECDFDVTEDQCDD